MNYKLIVGALLALTVVASGAAMAAPGNAPVDVPTTDYDQQADGADNASTATDADEDADDGAEATGPDEADDRGQADDERRGPPSDMPGPVPDFVGEIHDLINQHIDGAIDGVLGDHVSDVTPDNETDAGNGDVEMGNEASA